MTLQPHFDTAGTHVNTLEGATIAADWRPSLKSFVRQLDVSWHDMVENRTQK